MTSLAWEAVAHGGRVSLRVAGTDEDIEAASAHTGAFFPSIQLRPTDRDLATILARHDDRHSAAVEVGLAREFMSPLAALDGKAHPLHGLLGSLTGTGIDEDVVFQVLSAPVRHNWGQNVIRSVTAPDGSPFFLDAPGLTQDAETKVSSPLYAVVLRLAAVASTEERAWTLLSRLATSLDQFASPLGNEFAPLGTEDADRLIADIIDRKSHRTGMLLSLPELAGLISLPDASVASAVLERIPEPVERLPAEVLGQSGAVLGDAMHDGALTPVRVSPEARMQHVYVIGASGTGKSTLLERMILDDIASGAGVGVLDPHGDLIDDVIARLPDARINDVVLFDPTDAESTAGWNILAAYSSIEKELLASDLVGVFRRLSTSWGDQMSVVLGNAVMAFLESHEGGTLSDLRRFLIDDQYRKSFLSTVDDSHVTSFWTQEWPLLVGKRPQAPILTRLDTFLRSRMVRDAVTRRDGGINFRSVIDSGQIFLAKLAQGAIGDENAALLGSLIVSKFHQVSLARQDSALDSRRPFYLYIDEFQQVATPSMAGLFSGLRKFRLGVTVAHHDLYQLHANAPEVERAVLTNAYTRVFFRVSEEDARKMERGLGDFTADDLTSLARGEAICRIEQRDQAFRLHTRKLAPVDAQRAAERVAAVRRASKQQYGPRSSAPSERAPAPVPSVSNSAGPSTERTTPEPVRAIQPRLPAVDDGPGRGGAIHKYLQGLVRQWARDAGFRVEIEHELPGKGRVDVALFGERTSIACEIAGTTTIDQEIGNIKKCLDADFNAVIAISLDGKLLRKLEGAVADNFGEAQRSRVTLCAPEELISILRSKGEGADEPRVAGYRVRVRHSGANPVDDGAARRTIADVMLKSIKRLREKRE